VYAPVEAPLWLIISLPIGISAIKMIQLQRASTIALGLQKCFAVIAATWLTIIVLLMLYGGLNGVGLGALWALISAVCSVIGSFQTSKVGGLGKNNPR
jgi:hypothetical protein